jgi:hypothetical protein
MPPPFSEFSGGAGRSGNLVIIRFSAFFRDGETRSLPFSALFFLRPAFLRIGKTKGRLVRFTDWNCEDQGFANVEINLVYLL